MPKDEPQNIFPAKNILTIGAADYFMIHQKNPADYNAVGVHLVWGTEFDSCGRYVSAAPSPLEAFAAQVPESAEAVVGYRTSVSANQRGGSGNPTTVAYIASGTALIPRKLSLSEGTALIPRKLSLSKHSR